MGLVSVRFQQANGRVRSQLHPPALSCSGGLHFLPASEPALGVEITLKSKTAGEQSAMQWCLSLFLHMVISAVVS